MVKHDRTEFQMRGKVKVKANKEHDRHFSLESNSRTKKP